MVLLLSCEGGCVGVGGWVGVDVDVGVDVS